MTTKKNILISGGCGVAKAATEKFEREGWAVTAIGEPDSDITDRVSLCEKISRLENAGVLFDAALIVPGERLSTGFEQTDIAQWESLLKAWLGGTANICKAVAPKMIGRGRGCILIFCPDYKNSWEDNIMNATAGHTLHGFAKSFGAEAAQDGVRVNVLWAGLPFDSEAIADMAHYLAAVDKYTAAGVVSIAAMDKEVSAG